MEPTKQLVEFYDNGNDAVVKINGKIAQGWQVEQILHLNDGILVLFNVESVDINKLSDDEFSKLLATKGSEPNKTFYVRLKPFAERYHSAFSSVNLWYYQIPMNRKGNVIFKVKVVDHNIPNYDYWKDHWWQLVDRNGCFILKDDCEIVENSKK